MPLKTLEVKIGANTNGFQKGLRKVEYGLANLKNMVFDLAKSGLVIAGISVGLQQIGESMKAYVGLESSINRVNDLFADSSKYVKHFAENTALSLGMAESSAYQYAATYGNLFRTITASTEENAKVTISMLKASAVVSSKTGRTMDDVMERICSGLLGNTEAIEDLGIHVNVATLEMSDAFKKIANGRSWEKLNYYEQQQIRTLAILEQAHEGFGDEVQQSSAYSLAVLSGAFKDLQATVGSFLNNALQPAVKWLTELVRWANAGLKSLAAMLGFNVSISNAGTSSVKTQTKVQDKLTDAVNNTVKANKTLLAGFDEVNIITQKDISDSKSDKINSGISSMFSDLPDISFNESTKSAKKFADTLGAIKPFFEGIGEAIKDISKSVKAFYDTYLYNWLLNIGEWIKNNPKALKDLGYNLIIVASALMLYKGLSFVNEITGIGNLIKKLGKWHLKTINVTKAMKDKTAELDKQTTSTKAETVSVLVLVGAMAVAAVGIGAFAKVLGDLFPALLGNKDAAERLKNQLSELGILVRHDSEETVNSVTKKAEEGRHNLVNNTQQTSDEVSASLDGATNKWEDVFQKHYDKENEAFESQYQELSAKVDEKLNESGQTIENYFSKYENTVNDSITTSKNTVISGIDVISNKNNELSESFATLDKSILTSMNEATINIKSNIQTIGQSIDDLIAKIDLLNGKNTNNQQSSNMLTGPTQLASANEAIGRVGQIQSSNVLTGPTQLASANEAIGRVGQIQITANTAQATKSLVQKVALGIGNMFKNYTGFTETKSYRTFVKSIEYIIEKTLSLVSGLASTAGQAVLGFATGGVVTSATPAVVGEYPNAHSNPEIISPQNIMFDTVVEANAPMVSAIISAIQRLEQTLRDKDMEVSIGDDIIAQSAARGNNDHIARTGRSLLKV